MTGYSAAGLGGEPSLAGAGATCVRTEKLISVMSLINELIHHDAREETEHLWCCRPQPKQSKTQVLLRWALGRERTHHNEQGLWGPTP